MPPNAFADRQCSVHRQFGETEVSPGEAIAFVKRHGVVLQAARGPVPSLAEAIAGGPIRGSWWGHAKGREIFQAAQAVCKSPEVLVCKLIDGKVTYVHRRVWPALVKLAPRFRKAQLAKVWDEHTESGAHASRRIAFPRWVPSEVVKEAEALSIAEAQQVLSALLPRQAAKKQRMRPADPIVGAVAGSGAKLRPAVPPKKTRVAARPKRQSR
jgi:hypothetical protein